MTWFSDGSPYTYSMDAIRAWYRQESGGPSGVLICAGWLDADHPVPTGEPPPGFVDKLAWLCENDTHAGTRGYHRCDLCPPGKSRDFTLLDGREYVLGSAEIRVRTPHFTYAAPNLILHYVVDHHYLPPADFIDAVLATPDAPRRKEPSPFHGPYR